MLTNLLFILYCRSPDLNPIEMVWHELKEFVRREAKPRNKEELVSAIKTFWSTKLTRQSCNKYIDHLEKVIPQVIALNGAATSMQC